MARKSVRTALSNPQTRMGDFQAVTGKEARQFYRDYKKSGGQLAFPKGMSKAARNAIRKDLAAQQAAGGRMNVRAAFNKGVQAHTQAYAGKTGRRAGENRRMGERRQGERRAA